MPDGKEVAPEFAKEATIIETRLEPELVISKQPVWDLLHRGHANSRIQEIVRWSLEKLRKQIQDCKQLMDEVKLQRNA